MQVRGEPRADDANPNRIHHALSSFGAIRGSRHAVTT
jgi:hypothetical protein